MSTDMSTEAAAVLKDEGSASGNDSTIDLEHLGARASLADVERAYSKQEEEIEWNWVGDPNNPYNWPVWRKNYNVFMCALQAFVASVGTSLVSSSHDQFSKKWGIGITPSILPLSLYVLALGCGPVIGGPASEAFGRRPVYLIAAPLGAIFTLGAGFSNSFASFLVCRFLAGMAFSPALAIGSGTLSDMFKPEGRAIPFTLFILTPMLGPGLGPVIGSFVSVRKGWRWTQWTLIFFAIFAIIITLFSKETHHPILSRRRAKALNKPIQDSIPFASRIKLLLTIMISRPLYMLATEPIVTFICLYASCNFATLFSFFAGFPYVFGVTHNFSIEDTGLTFLSIVTGCVLGVPTILVCDRLLYRRQIPFHPPNKVPPEYRLYPAMIGSIGLPIGLFWFAWTARSDISWVSPVVAAVPFAWGNLCVFISTASYLADCYSPLVAASAFSANSLTRYTFGAAFPLFTVQMYTNLGIGWATSVLGFIAVALLPVPWVLFKYGKFIRAKSQYEIADY